MIEDYNETVFHKLVTGDYEEVEQIINRFIEQFPEEDLYRFLVIIYLEILQNGVEKISDLHVDYVTLHVDSIKMTNICHALNYLKQRNDNHDKVE
jgi:outer membrane protein assembly factor BamD (BamD/ComL family)